MEQGGYPKPLTLPCLLYGDQVTVLVPSLYMACCLGGQVGDASASQSPLSFGGFGTMLRHLPRLAAGVDSALGADALSQRALAVLQARPDLELFTQYFNLIIST